MLSKGIKNRYKYNIHFLNHTLQGVTQKHYKTSQPCDFVIYISKLSRLFYTMNRTQVVGTLHNRKAWCYHALAVFLMKSCG